MKKLLSFLLVCACLLGAASASPAVDALALLDRITAEELRRTGVTDVQAWLDGPLAEGAGVTSEWYVLALAHEGYDLTAYRAGLTGYLTEQLPRSTATRQKLALALRACGIPGEALPIASAIVDSVGQQGLMSWVWGLHLLNNGLPVNASKEEIIVHLLDGQFEDGGWALNGASADVDVTAMVLQALAPHQEDLEVHTAVERAVTLLSERQQTDGGFSSYGVANPESPAQVLIALSALGIDALTDPRFIKDGMTLLDGITPYCLPDGGLSHTAGGPRNHNATAQTFLGLSAYRLFREGKGSVYLYDAIASAPDSALVAASSSGLSWRGIASLTIIAVAAAVCLVLLLTGKRHRKNFLAVLVVAALLIALALTVDVQSADSYYSAPASPKTDPIGTVTLTIRCDPVAGREDFIPADGVILPETTFAIAEGDTVYTILTEAARAHRIQLENSGAPGMAYIAGMAYLYEQAYGDLSGWVYHVNGETPSTGCEQYLLRDGDVIRWDYTLQMGNDLR